MTDTTEKRKQMIYGALVADAAALGLHWIYAQPRIRRAAPEKPEFLEPDPANYEGVPSYFAHSRRHAGDFSMYGESALVLLRSLVERGAFDRQHYTRTFQEHFGFGGEYVGYIDTPTRITLQNLIKAEETLLEKALSVPFEGDEQQKQAVASKVVGNAQLLQGDELREKVQEAIRLTKGSEAQMNLAEAMITTLESERSYPGADDDQLPALTRVPLLVARYHNDPALEQYVEDAVRVTNNNDTAVAWSLFLTRLLVWTLQDDASRDTFETALEQILERSSEDIAAAIHNVIRRKGEDNKSVTMKIGPACHLEQGIPVAIHNLLGASDYVDAVRRNIYACGDSCGRASVVGSVAAVLYGPVPDEWTGRLTRRTEVDQLVTALIS